MNVFSVSAGKTKLSVLVIRRNFWLSVSPGSAETLVTESKKIEYRLTAYFLSNISAKNCQNRLMYVEVVSSFVFETHCRVI